MIKAILAGFILFLFVVTTVAANKGTYQCNANNPQNCPIPTQICSNGEAVGNPHCQPTGEATQGPSIEPETTEGPTVSPSVTLEPTTPPSPHGDGLSDGRESGHINAPEPSLIPQVGWK